MVQNTALAGQQLAAILSLKQTAAELLATASQPDFDVSPLVAAIQERFSQMHQPLEKLALGEPALMAHKICRNAEHSLHGISTLLSSSWESACQKIRFELLPLLEELYVDLYFWGFCYPNQEKMQQYYRTEMLKLCPLPNAFRYEVSIVVLAYDKLEYTKLCLEYLQRYFPAHISHELILVNNGSRDGTQAFFQSLKPDKQVDFLHNTKSLACLSRIIEGKYTLFISNDILITPHAVENMLACLESDFSIGCVVPTCAHTSNVQAIPAKYANEAELLAFAEQNNQQDPCRWEQRVRVIPPIVMAPSHQEGIHAFFGYWYPFFSERFLAFTDDLMSLLLRRGGLKAMVAKDAYVHHFGSVTIGNSPEQSARLSNGYQAFIAAFGINPWGQGMYFDQALMDALSFDWVSQPLNVLGINCGTGSNPLKIKSLLAEKQRNRQVSIYNVTDQMLCEPELAGVSDYHQLIQPLEQAENLFPGIGFAYIVGERVDSLADPAGFCRQLYNRLIPGGEMALSATDAGVQELIKDLFPACRQVQSWFLVKKTN